MNQSSSTSTLFNSKPHYEILDALRGVAALIVVWYHIYECFPLDYQIFKHGYLAVDFFFILSGFVIGYAYDNRWKSMTKGAFMKRRLIRLHPMVIMGLLLGVITFIIQGAQQWDGSKVATSMIMIAVLLNLFMLPNIPGSPTEVRGNGEMSPLNGPTWSLFFEYIANIFYMLFLRKLSNKALTIFTTISAVALIAYAVVDIPGYGTIGVGWTLADTNFIGGLLRVTFPFSAGLLISRKFKPIKIKGAFCICSLMLLGLLAVLFINIGGSTLFNRLYDIFAIIFLFPLILYLGASGGVNSKKPNRFYRTLGDLSYPLYLVHYPFMYLFYHYIGFPNTFRTPSETWPYHILLFVGNILLAFIILKLYDEPVRKWLTNRTKIKGIGKHCVS